MLIVCPNCATSYMIDPAMMPPAGRTVRCARCKTTWFASGSQSPANVSAFVDGVIAEAEAQSETPQPSAGQPTTDAPAPEPVDDFGGEPPETIQQARAIEAAPQAGEGEPATPSSHDERIQVTDAPPLVPPMAQTTAGTLDDDEVESFAARRERLRVRREHKRRSSRWTAIILVLAAFNVALIGARNEVVRYLPQTASLFAAIGLPVNLRNLKFENVKIAKQTENGVDTLIVSGTIVSTSNSPTEVPRLRFSVRNASGQEIYTWRALPDRSILEPGEKLDFHSRLASPPADAADVLVRFFTANDAASGRK